MECWLWTEHCDMVFPAFNSDADECFLFMCWSNTVRVFMKPLFCKYSRKIASARTSNLSSIFPEWNHPWLQQPFMGLKFEGPKAAMAVWFLNILLFCKMCRLEDLLLGVERVRRKRSKDLVWVKKRLKKFVKLSISSILMAQVIIWLSVDLLILCFRNYRSQRA